MEVINGNLIQLALEGEFDLIIHGCNCFCSMEAGIAKGIRIQFPEAFQADMKTLKGDSYKLGSISWAKCQAYKREILLVNAYTQYNFTGPPPLVDYDAVRSCFKQIKQHFSGLKMGYPKIGAGLGGGDWNIIASIINEELHDENHTLVVFGGD